ncbi:MAG: hypothetical protein FD164_2371 [Nitrospirae bacterium]|nr:MAG: hypothetical protein FD164_2371 [Nitrospirota bacterium]
MRTHRRPRNKYDITIKLGYTNGPPVGVYERVAGYTPEQALGWLCKQYNALGRKEDLWALYTNSRTDVITIEEVGRFGKPIEPPKPAVQIRLF